MKTEGRLKITCVRNRTETNAILIYIYIYLYPINEPNQPKNTKNQNLGAQKNKAEKNNNLNQSNRKFFYEQIINSKINAI